MSPDGKDGCARRDTCWVGWMARGRGTELPGSGGQTGREAGEEILKRGAQRDKVALLCFRQTRPW